jgi:hypothetical protein
MSINLNDYSKDFKIDLGNEINDTTLRYLGLLSMKSNANRYIPFTHSESRVNDKICRVDLYSGIAISFGLSGYQKLVHYIYKNKETLRSVTVDDFVKRLTKTDCEKYVQICIDHYNLCIAMVKKIVMDYADPNPGTHNIYQWNYRSDMNMLLRFEDVPKVCPKNDGTIATLVNLASCLIINKYDYSIIPKIISKVNKYANIVERIYNFNFKLCIVLSDIENEERISILEAKIAELLIDKAKN